MPKAVYGRTEPKNRHLTVTANGEEHEAPWKEGVGIYVDGHDFGKGDSVEIDGTVCRVVEMRRMMLENQAVSPIIKLVRGKPQNLPAYLIPVQRMATNRRLRAPNDGEVVVLL